MTEGQKNFIVFGGCFAVAAVALGLNLSGDEMIQGQMAATQHAPETEEESEYMLSMMICGFIDALTDWKRADLYQAVAFAEGFTCNSGAIVDFDAGEAVLPVVRIGSKTIHHLPWRTKLEPDQAADELSDRVREWLSSLANAKAA